MKEDNQNYSLFRLETYYTMSDDITIKCFEYIDTFKTLKEAKIAQEKEELKTIIIPTY